jgi:N4-gp56 family major capsid protein
MANTTAATLSGDVLAYLAQEVLPIAQKQLVVHQFGQQHKLPKGRGTTMTFTRYMRLPLPFAPLSEGVPAVAQALTIQQVTGTAQQWGGQVTITDVAELTIFHDPFQQAKRMLGYQMAETMERNDFLTLMGSTQVNYVNSKGSRANLAAGDVLDPFTVQRTQIALQNGSSFLGGAPMFNGPEGTNVKEDIRKYRDGGRPQTTPHYVAVSSFMTIGDLRQNPIVSNAWSFSEVERLYNAEIGQWSSIRFCGSNMVPSWTGVSNAGITATPGSAGSLPNGTYALILTGVDTQNQYESRVYATITAISVTAGGTGSVAFTTPNIAGFTFNAYLSTATSPANLGLSPQGPTAGAMTGQAVQLPANTAITLTGVGLAQTPPAAPTAGVQVFPTFVFGEGAFGVVELDDVKYAYLNQPEKADPMNQLRVATWKCYLGGMLLNSSFMARIESTSAFSTTFG